MEAGTFARHIVHPWRYRGRLCHANLHSQAGLVPRPTLDLARTCRLVPADCGYRYRRALGGKSWWMDWSSHSLRTGLLRTRRDQFYVS